MTIQEKAKAYDKALFKAMELGGDLTMPRSVAEKLFIIFPELKENEDEKIRKEIIKYIKTGTYHKSWVAWLEKQKPINVNAVEKKEKMSKRYDSMDELIADALIKMVEESDLIDRDKSNRIYWITKHRQKPIEWTKKDDNRLKNCIRLIGNAAYSTVSEQENAIEWIKSLKERYK